MSIVDLSCISSEGSGNQKKFWVGNTLVKLNSNCHEADKEVSAFKIGRELGLNVLEYRLGKYEYGGTLYNGCECDNFVALGEEAVTLYECLTTTAIPDKLSAQSYFNVSVDSVYQMTYGYFSKEAISIYLKSILIFDYLVCNGDRHLSNIEFLRGNGYWRFAPIYDNGQAFLGRNGVKSKSELDRLLQKFKTRPFSSNPEKNLIDLKFAKYFCQSIDLDKIKALDINSFHKQLFIRRVNYLLNNL